MLSKKEAGILAATAAGLESRISAGRRRTSDALMSWGLLTLECVIVEGVIEAHYAVTTKGLAVLATIENIELTEKAS
jgi:hypothetical protein